MIKRLGPLVILLLCLALALPGCSSGSTGSDSSGDGQAANGSGGDDSGSADSGAARLTAADVRALIEGDFASEPWASSASDISETTLLRRPVVSIAFPDADSRMAASAALQTALPSGKFGVLELSEPDFTEFARIGSPTGDDVVALPASPTSAEEFLPWLEQAFGAESPAPEGWVAHVKGTEFAASVPSGYSDVLVVRTDLPWNAEGRRVAAVIEQAIQTAAPSFAANYAIYFGDDDYQMSGQIVPGIAAFGY